MTHKKYKAYTLVLLMITVTALVITAAMLSLRREADSQAAAAQTAAAQSALVPGPERTQRVLDSGAQGDSNSAYYTPNTAASQESAAKGEEKGDEGYFITIYKGKLGVFKAGQAEPVVVREKEVLLLPEEDLRLLREGIWAKDMNEVRQILEDYD